MRRDWQKLNNPPVILAAMEIRYMLPKDFKVSILKKDEEFININLPDRLDNFTGNINMPNPTEGLSTAQVTNKQTGYIYLNKEKNKRLLISNENISYVIEGKYPGWEVFIKECLDYIDHFKQILGDIVILRMSIRFINRLMFNELNAIEDYFNVAISASEGTIEYPIDTYFIKYGIHIPETGIRANVVQSLEERSADSYLFIFDIDVLHDMQENFYSINFEENFEELRNLKNDIFFKNLTAKTLKTL